MKKEEEAERRAKEEESTVPTKAQLPGASVAAAVAATQSAGSKRRNRWDQNVEQEDAKKAKAGSEWDNPDATPGPSRWDATATPGHASVDATPACARRRNRWDETPTPRGASDADATPAGGGATSWCHPCRHDLGCHSQACRCCHSYAKEAEAPMTPEQYNMLRWEKDIEDRNRPLSDEELESMFPMDGYKILDPPASYVPIRIPACKLLASPTLLGGTPLYTIPEEDRNQQYDVPKEAAGGLPMMKPEDYQYFGALLTKKEGEEMTAEESKECKMMKLLLKVKNGTPPQWKTALRQLTDKARELGAGPLFNQILPSPTLEDQEWHLLVKVIDRVLYKLDELVRPFVHKILVVIEPLLIDEDYYACVEAHEIISNLSKAARLATMIAAMRPDIDNVDEYVRNTTGRAFSVVASALGIPALLPFLKAHGLSDENQKVRTITALLLAALAEAAAPYGIASFDSVLKPLWKGNRSHRGKVLAAFLKAIGFIIPLMDAMYASYYTKEVMVILIREFQSPDEQMKKVVLNVVKQCVGTEGVEASYVRQEILPEFFCNLWVRRMALDCRNYQQLVDTTVEVANKVGVADVVG
ncbi:unnamed protein product [Sphagnum jensenii]|uniref:Splicing factor 3B subunit 1 domain-containing protein n=1 Tax=Sphagnum jensenii TaxID=128206 RepID=A0ABP1BMW7_9BRYO